MKGLAFAYDPSGYWVELVKRNAEAGHQEKFNLGQTMLRVKDADKSLEFYTGKGGMGMTKVGRIQTLSNHVARVQSSHSAKMMPSSCEARSFFYLDVGSSASW